MTADPWALLAEIHELQPWLSQDADLAARVELALAERQDSATGVVEWTTDAFGNDYVKQGDVLLMVVETIDGRWGWGTRVEGYATTEAEAKAAAIAAARGLR
jgi:hypothetical protein